MPNSIYKFLFIVSLFVFASFSAPKKKTIIVFKHGSELTYDVDANSEKFELKIKIKKVNPGIVFSYQTTGPRDKKGTITISEKDLDSALSLHNDFSGGNVTLNDEVSIFLSRTIYAELAMAGMNDGGSSFKPNSNEAMDAFVKAEPVQYELKVNGKKMQVDGERSYDYVDEKHGNYHYAFTLLKNENYPLILEMNFGWIMKLKQMDDVEVVKVDE